MKRTKILNNIQKSFRTFGGGRGSNTNPIADALKHKPLQFAAGVDVGEVINLVLQESGHADLMGLLDNIIKGVDIDIESVKALWNKIEAR